MVQSPCLDCSCSCLQKSNLGQHLCVMCFNHNNRITQKLHHCVFIDLAGRKAEKILWSVVSALIFTIQPQEAPAGRYRGVRSSQRRRQIVSNREEVGGKRKTWRDEKVSLEPSLGSRPFHSVLLLHLKRAPPPAPLHRPLSAGAQKSPQMCVFFFSTKRLKALHL